MPAKGNRAGPNRKGVGHNAHDAKAEAKAIRNAFEELKDIKERRTAFNARMKRRRDKVVAVFKNLGMKMGHVEEEFNNFCIEMGEADDAVHKAENDRALRLDTTRRIHAALHDGAQLDWVDLQEKADRARKEAEEEAGAADEEIDDDGESDKTEE